MSTKVYILSKIVRFQAKSGATLSAQMPLPEPNDIEEAARLFRAAAKMAELKGFSVEDLAIELQVSRRTILNWTQGSTHVPVSALLRTCRLAGVKLDRLYLLIGNDDDNWASVVGETPRRPRLRVVLGYLALGCFVVLVAGSRSPYPADWWRNAQTVVQHVAAPSVETARVPARLVSDSPQPEPTAAAMPAPMPVPTAQRRPSPTPVATPTPEPSAAPVQVSVAIAPTPTPAPPSPAVPAVSASPAPKHCLLLLCP